MKKRTAHARQEKGLTLETGFLNAQPGWQSSYENSFNGLRAVAAQTISVPAIGRSNEVGVNGAAGNPSTHFVRLVHASSHPMRFQIRTH